MCYSTPHLSTDVQWTFIKRPYWTCGGPKISYDGRLSEMKTACLKMTKTDVSFKPSRDVMYDSWTSKGPQPDVYWTPTRCLFDDCSQC